MEKETIDKLEFNTIVGLKQYNLTTEEKAEIIKDYKDKHKLRYKDMEKITGINKQTLRRMVDYKKARKIDRIRRLNQIEISSDQVKENIYTFYKMIRLYNHSISKREFKYNSSIKKNLNNLKHEFDEFYEYIMGKK